jgi:hypothetical protein
MSYKVSEIYHSETRNSNCSRDKSVSYCAGRNKRQINGDSPVVCRTSRGSTVQIRTWRSALIKVQQLWSEFYLQYGPFFAKNNKPILNRLARFRCRNTTSHATVRFPRKTLFCGSNVIVLSHAGVRKPELQSARTALPGLRPSTHLFNGLQTAFSGSSQSFRRLSK